MSMNNNTDDWNRQAQHETNLVRWGKLYETCLHSDRITGEIGMLVLKISMLVNGGALIAVLPLLSNAESGQDLIQKLVNSATWFAAGLLTAVVATGISYFYQMAVTARDWNHLYEAGGQDVPYRIAHRLAWIFICVIVVLVLASIIFFGVGLIDGVRAYNKA